MKAATPSSLDRQLDELGAVALLATLHGVLDRLGRRAPSEVGDGALVAGVEALHRAQTRVWAEQGRWMREADQRRTFLRDGHRSTGDQLAERLHLSKGQGRAEAETALALAALPSTAARVAAGEVGVEQARVAARALHETPEAQRAGLDALVAERGAQVDARQLRDEVEAWQAKYVPESLQDRERRARTLRSLRVWKTKDGMGAGAWRLDPASHARVVALLDALARPQEGETRTREQRMADALTDAADRVLLNDDAPRAGGLPVRALVIVPEGALRDDPDAEPAVPGGPGGQTPRPTSTGTGRSATPARGSWCAAPTTSSSSASGSTARSSTSATPTANPRPRSG
jgi:hypothetical protein